MTTPAEFVAYCQSFVGLPYIWGADGPDAFDCSGLAQQLLASIGIDPAEDQTAHGLFRHFSQPGRSVPTSIPVVGTLVFFGRVGRIGHVGVAVSGATMVEAAHGGPEVTSVAIARRVGAEVQVNRVSRRRDLVAKLTPTALPWTPEMAQARTQFVLASVRAMGASRSRERR
jgi:cell wall-associated NlpC family hydrolase